MGMFESDRVCEQPAPTPAAAGPTVLEPVVRVVLVGGPELEPVGNDAVPAPNGEPPGQACQSRA